MLQCQEEEMKVLFRIILQAFSSINLYLTCLEGFELEDGRTWLDEEDEDKKTVGDKLKSGLMKTTVAAVFHPLHNAKTLIQVGVALRFHE